MMDLPFIAITKKAVCSFQLAIYNHIGPTFNKKKTLLCRILLFQRFNWLNNHFGVACRAQINFAAGAGKTVAAGAQNIEAGELKSTCLTGINFFFPR